MLLSLRFLCSRAGVFSLDVCYYLLAMKNKAHKFVIFDWSGVISDDRRTVYEANMKILADYGKPRLKYDQWLVSSAANAVDFIQSQGVNEKAAKLAELYECYLNEVECRGIKPVMYRDAPDVLKHVRRRGKRAAVLSSHPAENLQDEAESYGLLCYFDLLEGGSRNKAHDIVTICRRFCVAPSSVIYVGDMTYDIRSAKKAGVSAGGVATGYHSRERLQAEDPDYLLDSLLELKSII